MINSTVPPSTPLDAPAYTFHANPDFVHARTFLENLISQHPDSANLITAYVELCSKYQETQLAIHKEIDEFTLKQTKIVSDDRIERMKLTTDCFKEQSARHQEWIKDAAAQGVEVKGLQSFLLAPDFVNILPLSFSRL